MHILTEDQYYAEMEPVLKQIFDIGAGYDDHILFTNSILGRRIFHVDMARVDDALLNAVIHAARFLGDPGCYVTLLSRIQKQPNHCYVPLAEMHTALVEGKLESDMGMRFWLEYAIYSTQGRWGLVTTSAKFGLLGGSYEFIQQVELAFPSLNDQVYNFLQHWREEELYEIEHHTDPEWPIRVNTWIPELLQHVYGDELTMRMLQEVKFYSGD